MKPLKILHTAHTYLPERNGIAEVVRRISEGLAKRGHDVHVATAPARDRRDTRIAGVNVWSFDAHGNYLDGMGGDLAAYRAFVRSGAWDVIASHHAHTWSTDAILDCLPTLSAAKVFVPHGFPRLGNPAAAPYYSRAPELLDRYDCIVCLSDSFEELRFCQSAGITRTRVIPNGVDGEEMGAAASGHRNRLRTPGKRLVLNVSNHTPHKGHPTLMRLATRFERDAVDFVQMGESYRAGRYGLGRIGIQGGCHYRCRWTAWRHSNYRSIRPTSRAETVSAFREADVFVLTSWRETSPLVILEAMAAGLPWVSFDVGNVRDHVGGIVVRDLTEMEKAVRMLLSDDRTRRQLGEDGRRRAIARHSWSGIVDAYEALYIDLVKTKNR